ncbi:MAG TPA: NUDIX domain-containing protein [Candidatus Peribacteraceae bacterium]|nr:NUDIX domain-containing protein [Candidatus Peribacteraceae bacterium]
MNSEFSHSAGGVVVGPHGKVLLVLQRDRTWSLPKGHIKDGEDPRDAAVREIIEEAGIIDLQMIKILKSYSRFRLTNTGREDMHSLKRITMYLFITNQTQLMPADPRTPEAQWIDPEEVPNILSHPKDQEFFASILSDIEECIMQHFTETLGV